MLMIDEPIFWLVVLFDIALSIEKFSIPQVSGTHKVSIFVFEIISEHFKTSPIDSNEPRLHAILMKIMRIMNILVFCFSSGLILIEPEYYPVSCEL